MLHPPCTVHLQLAQAQSLAVPLLTSQQLYLPPVIYRSLISSTNTTATTYVAPTSGLATLPATLDVPSDVHTPGAWMTQQLPPLSNF